jgi:hypothetical protein
MRRSCRREIGSSCEDGVRNWVHRPLLMSPTLHLNNRILPASSHIQQRPRHTDTAGNVACMQGLALMLPSHVPSHLESASGSTPWPSCVIAGLRQFDRPTAAAFVSSSSSPATTVSGVTWKALMCFPPFLFMRLV